MKVEIKILGGPYAGSPAWIGDLYRAPSTVLVPEGIDSHRTAIEAQRAKAEIGALLDRHIRVEVAAIRWAIRVTRLPEVPE
jgi:hypothetical protein